MLKIIFVFYFNFQQIIPISSSSYKTQQKKTMEPSFITIPANIYKQKIIYATTIPSILFLNTTVVPSTTSAVGGVVDGAAGGGGGGVGTTATPSWLSAGRIQIPLYAAILLLAIIGNFLVIITLVQNRRMRTITNVFLLNLAVSDILLGVLCMPFTLIGSLLRDFVFGEVMCKCLPYLQGKCLFSNFNTTHFTNNHNNVVLFNKSFYQNFMYNKLTHG